MRIITITIIFLFTFSIVQAQSTKKSDLNYKPINLEEAVGQLIKIQNDTIKQEIISMTEEEFTGRAHMGLGMWMRNNWGLWRGGQLAKYFNALGILHPDDMSGIILTCYYRKLHNQDWKLDEQIKFYEDFWKSSKQNYNKLETDTTYQRQFKVRNDSLMREYINKKKSEWKPGTIISGYLVYQCGSIALSERTKVKGEIIQWQNDKIVLRITQYFDEKKKKKVIKCNNISNNVVVVENDEDFMIDK